MLDAKFRYLELAGLAQGEEDKALLREREAYRHLLPAPPPTFIDDRERDYLTQVTGLEEDILMSVEQGDIAYQDILSIIVWEEEDDRNERLGAPELPEP